MPRPKKDRHICQMPENTGFAPLGESRGEITMTLDEYEVVRLIDMVGMRQERCAAQMQVARSTVTGIYESARKKIARALVEGLTLTIEGGDVNLCHNSEICTHQCGMDDCLECASQK